MMMPFKSITVFSDYFAESVAEGGRISQKVKVDKGERDTSLEKEIIAKYEQDLDLQVSDGVEEKIEEKTKEDINNMAVSTIDVKNLREKTGAGMMDCKRALTETDGDIESAIDFLRAKGLARAAKRPLELLPKDLLELR